MAMHMMIWKQLTVIMLWQGNRKYRRCPSEEHMNENYMLCGKCELSSEMSRDAVATLMVRFYMEHELKLESTTFWDVKPCIMVQVYRSFGGK
jgi:hypothetical protein